MQAVVTEATVTLSLPAPAPALDTRQSFSKLFIIAGDDIQSFFTMNYPPTSRYLNDDFSHPDSSSRPWTPAHSDEDWKLHSGKVSYLTNNDSTQQLSPSIPFQTEQPKERNPVKRWWSVVRLCSILLRFFEPDI